jgi:type IV pilus assembly protein PilA
MLKRLNQKGFSLVELMVVVAIIGILASIAIPQFQKFTAKARQGEAKTQLGALAKFQGAFKAEFLGYSNIFSVMGYTPEGNMRYNIGFGDATAIVPTEYTNIKGNVALSTTAGHKTVQNLRLYCGGAINTPMNGCGMVAGSNGLVIGDFVAGGVGTPPGGQYTAMNATAGYATVNNTVRGEPAFIAGAIGFIYRGRVDAWSIDDNGFLRNGTDGLQ